MNWREYLFSVKGRVSRVHYWKILLATVGVGLTSNLVITQAVGISFHDFGREVSGDGLWSAAGRQVLAFMLPVWAVTIALTNAIYVKRLHDRNRSGWWLILMVYGPWVTDFVLRAFYDPHSITHMLIRGTSNLLGLWGFIELGFLPGTRGANRFGPDPLQKA